MKFHLFVAVVIILLSLSACTRDYPPPAPLANSGFLYQANDTAPLAIALDASGTSHIARLECNQDSPYQCRILYQAFASGRQLALQPWLPDNGYTFRNPDVAVTDSGLAVITWQNCETGSNNCSTWFMRSSDLFSAIVLEIGTFSQNRPLVLSRGEYLYAIHEVRISATASGLRYCRILAASTDCHWVSGHADDGTFRADPAAAITSLGTLHVNYLQKAVGSMTAWYADNSGNTNADMDAAPNHTLNMGSATRFLPPAAAIETDDGYIYFALARDELASDAMDVFYINPFNTADGGIKSYNLDAGKQWAIYGRPSLTASSSTSYVAFAALTTDHPQQTDIYWSSFSAGDASPSNPSRPYPTNLTAGDYDCDPVITQVSGWAFIGWHICGFPPATNDVYFYSVTGGQIIHSANWQGRGTLDMASNGDYVAGIWNELYTDAAGEKLHTWLAYNANMLWLPVVKK